MYFDMRISKAWRERNKRKEGGKRGRERRREKEKEGRGTSAGDKAFEYSRKVSVELTPASCPTEFEFNE